MTADRIALVVKGSVFTAGGVQSSAERIAGALTAAGPFAVDVLMLRPDHCTSPGQDFYDLAPAAVRDRIRYFELPGANPAAAEPERAFTAHLGLIALLRRERYRLVHGLYASVAGFHAAFAAAECGIPCVVGLRGNDIHADVFHAGRFAQLQWALGHAAAVTAVSTEALLRADLLTGCGSRGRVILNSIDPAAYREGVEPSVVAAAQPGAVLVGSLAKFRSKKAPGTLLAAFQLLRKDIPEARLVLSGEIGRDARPEVEETIETLGLSGHVSLTGAFPREDALRHLRGMDLFVHPALHDGCPNAVLEAMAANTPVVASAVGAVPEMITDGREGRLVARAGSPEALRDAMLDVLAAPDRGAAYATRALEALGTRFAPEREAGELNAVYESCLPAPASAPPLVPSAAPGTGRPVGYAAEATGGGETPATLVGTPEQLRRAVAGNRPKTVHIEGTIRLDGQIDVGSNTTLTGQGTDALLVGGGLRIRGQHNVIVRNLTIGLPTGTDGILVHSSTLVWIDHNEFYGDRDHGKDWYSGLVDIVHGSDLVTLSWNVFRDHFKTMLIGHSDDNAAEDSGRLRITLHHNWFHDVNSRTPSLRFGTLHAFNNLYERIGSTAVNLRMGARGLVEANVFSSCPVAVTSRFSREQGAAVLRDNELSAARTEAPAASSAAETVPYPYRPDPPEDVTGRVRNGAGPRRPG